MSKTDDTGKDEEAYLGHWPHWPRLQGSGLWAVRGLHAFVGFSDFPVSASLNTDCKLCELLVFCFWARHVETQGP